MGQYRQYLQHLSAHSPTTAFLCKTLLGLKLLDEFYLGLDLSHTELTCTIINDHYTPVFRRMVRYDTDLPPEYTKQYSGNPAITWMAALDKLFTDIAESLEFDLGRVSVIGGCSDAGIAIWKQGSEAILANLDPSTSMNQQLEDALLPINTSDKAAQEDMLGNESKRTPQAVAKMLSKVPNDTAERAERISLSGPLLASLLMGKYADIEMSDARMAGLWDMQNQSWDKGIMDGRDHMAHKLGDPCNGKKSLGLVSAYCAKRWRISKNCLVFPFLNNRTAELINMNLASGDCVLQLGRRDTIYCYLPLSPSSNTTDDFIFDPRYPELGFGSFSLSTGTDVRRQTCGNDWVKFGDSLRETHPGCLSEDENAPRVPRFSFISQKHTHLSDSLAAADSIKLNLWRYEDGHKVAAFHVRKPELPDENKLDWNTGHMSIEQLNAHKVAQYDVRSLIDTMLLSLRSQLRTITWGDSTGIRRILVIGKDPLSRSGSFLQLISNALKLPVYTLRLTIEIGNSDADTRCMTMALLSRFYVIRKNALEELDKPGPLEATATTELQRDPLWVDAIQNERATRRDKAITTLPKMIKQDDRVRQFHLKVAEPQAADVYKYEEIYAEFSRCQKEMFKAE